MNQESAASEFTISRHWHVAILASYYLLLFYFLINSLYALDSIRITTAVIWLIQIFPLLLFLPGLHQKKSRTYLWLSLVVLLYFMHGVLVSFDSTQQLWGIFEIAACVALFTTLMAAMLEKRTHSKKTV